jgi:uncharacterized protein (TIGR02246 family)
VPDPAVQRLLDRAEIEQLKARYFRCVDLRLWDELAGVFSDDAEMHIADTHTRGRDAIVAMIRAALDGVRTVHHGHMPEIAFQGDDRATGIWAMFDVSEPEGMPVRVGFGHYHEEYVRDGGAWRIAAVRLERLRLDHVALR